MFNERVQGGCGTPGTDMFASWSKWHGSVPGNGYDPEAAEKFLDEAKADGYDGKLTYVGMNDPGTQRSALAYQSMLQAVGFTVEISYATSINDLISRQFSKHDFDISYSGFNVLESTSAAEFSKASSDWSTTPLRWLWSIRARCSLRGDRMCTA